MIFIQRVRSNDIGEDYGKQVELGKVFMAHHKWEVGTIPVIITFCAMTPEQDALNGTKLTTSFKVRGDERGGDRIGVDCKEYANEERICVLKKFLTDQLHLTPGEDYFILEDVGNDGRTFKLYGIHGNQVLATTLLDKFKGQFIDVEDHNENTSLKSSLDEPLQQIFFGAPGTGKSFEINEMCAEYENYRTTFHPDTDYASFVGSYKPITKRVPQYDIYHNVIIDKETNEPVMEDRIVYRYVFQSFLKAYIAAWREQQNEQPKPVFLVVEEINRGNCAQIFGDIFQLLDRNEAGYSDYPIVADDDLAQELKREFSGLNVSNADGINALYKGGKDVVGSVKNGARLLLPNNLYIWATMNTSDQSLFPIDSAFKRRWDWKYIKIKDNAKDYKIVFTNGNKYDWWQFVTAINERIEGGEIQQEDKKLGYFFAKSKNGIITAERFLSKVIFFLYNDVFKDFGFDEDYFKGTDGLPMTFASYFDDSGEANEDQIERFLNNLGLKPKSSEDDKEESMVEVVADASDGFYVSGQKCSRRACQGLIVKKAIENAKANGESLTVADLSDIAKRTFITPRGKQMNKPFFVLASNWEEYKATSSDPRVIEKFETDTLIDTDDVEFYVYCNFGANDEQNIGNFANALGINTSGLSK